MESINSIAGRYVDVTVRCDRKFTFSYECIDEVATRKICEFFNGKAIIEVSADEECGTYIYCDLV